MAPPVLEETRFEIKIGTVDNIHLPEKKRETSRKVQYSTEVDVTHYSPDVEVYAHHLDDDSGGCSTLYQCSLDPRPATQLIHSSKSTLLGACFSCSVLKQNLKAWHTGLLA